MGPVGIKKGASALFFMVLGWGWWLKIVH